jgi:hypothetical protein
LRLRVGERRTASLVQKPSLHRGKPGGGKEGGRPLLVQKPPLHRGKPGGGPVQAGLTGRFNYFGTSKTWPQLLQVRSA